MRMSDDMINVLKKADDLLHMTFQRYQDYIADGSYFNILAAIGRERDETQVHSKIIYFLLNSSCMKNEHQKFLKLFLQAINVPEQYLDDQWLAYREKVFENGRIDFVIESRNFCAAIEMKIDAVDEECQLERYDSFCRKKRKEYYVYYLTLDGHAPSGQSTGNMAQDKLRLISFQTEIAEWIQKCMKAVNEMGYKYSFLKQYLGAIRHMTGLDKEEVNVEDLITNAGMGKAAMMIIDSFYKKMEHVIETFFCKLGAILEKKSGLDTYVYQDEIRQYYFSKRARSGTETVIERMEYQENTYDFVFCLEVEDYLYASFGFVTETDDIWLPLADVQEILPEFYDKCMEKVEHLNLPMIKQSTYTAWYYIENTKGEFLNFRNYGDSVIELLDEMDAQCEFIAENIVEQVLRPLSSDINETIF